ncbi:MAG TPA: UDP-N-acetylglucosamine--N-acetylmuramyl-(pentapeptide) pyrophosphoryl-undecaprenol N-acetylglucosamine transferase [Candidatus Babeliales bacterium]|nr:UDP-N-acetylglucosamine--N-acetylmuramyl-(pentapeptide) pyrophosphoryl-undecaprenol N-acetylglucosamine transferase [Candidatus Babeliales bacterium]
MNQNQTICFVAGRSGGHIIPALTLAHAHKKEYPTSRVLFFSTNTPLDTAIISADNSVDTYYQLPMDNIPKRWYRIPKYLYHATRSFFTSFYQLYKHKPALVISTGGYIGLPVCFAAWILRIPLELWELNALPGRSAHLLARFATKIHVVFDACKQYFPKQKTVVSAYPIRFTEKQISREQACTMINLDPYKKTILVLGGSQGSVSINTIIKQSLAHIENLRAVQCIHQTGAADTSNWHEIYAQHNMQAYICAYTNEIEPLYNAADLIICRAGAGSLFETVYFKKPAIIIPLETAITDHQLDNARAIALQYPELCTVLREQDIKRDPQEFYTMINTLLYKHITQRG